MKQQNGGGDLFNLTYSVGGPDLLHHAGESSQERRKYDATAPR